MKGQRVRINKKYHIEELIGLEGAIVDNEKGTYINITLRKNLSIHADCLTQFGLRLIQAHKTNTEGIHRLKQKIIINAL